MREIAMLRNQLGLSQAELARLVGVSRASISLAEIGRRSLPTSVLMRLGELVSQTHHLAVEIDPERENEMIALAQSHQAHEEKDLQRLLAARERLRKDLVRMERRHQSALQALSLLAREKALFADIPTQLKRLERMTEEAQSDWALNHPAQQRPLIVRLADLDARIASRENLLADFLHTSIKPIQK